MAIGRKPYTHTEEELLAEYLAKRPNTDWYEKRQRLGDIDEAHRALFKTEKARAIFTPTLQWVDAIAWYKDEPTLIECKDWARVMNPLYQLKTYERLFKQTPRYANSWPKPVHLELCSALYSPHIPPAAAEMGIKCYLYRPAWILVRLKEKYRIGGYDPITQITEVV